MRGARCGWTKLKVLRVGSKINAQAESGGSRVWGAMVAVAQRRRSSGEISH